MSDQNNAIPHNATRVPVWQVVREAWVLLRAEAVALLQFTFWPVLIMVLLQFLPSMVTHQQNQQALLSLVGKLVTAVLGAIVQVRAYRYLLLGETQAGPIGRFGAREWHYIWRGFLLSLILVAACVPALIIAAQWLITYTQVKHAASLPLPKMAAMALSVMLTIFLSMRFMFVMPMAATDGDDRFKTAWDVTRGVTLRLIAVMVLAFIPYLGLLVVDVLIEKGAKYASLIPLYTVQFIAAVILVMLQIMLSSSVMSVLAYRLGLVMPRAAVTQSDAGVA